MRNSCLFIFIFISMRCDAMKCMNLAIVFLARFCRVMIGPWWYLFAKDGCLMLHFFLLESWHPKCILTATTCVHNALQNSNSVSMHTSTILFIRGVVAIEQKIMRN